jgi:peptide-methionine (S)-S-oxide reductase
VIFFHNNRQKQIAEETIKDFARPLYKDPIVTQLEPYTRFYPAGPEMQDYYNRNPNAPYCLIVIDPKIQKLRQMFAAKLK